MLTIDSKLSTYSLAAGEPFVLDIQFQDATASVIPLTDRAFVLSLYRSNREIVQTITGETLTDTSGSFVRFQRDGTFSEGLFGQNGIVVELAERLRNGKSVLASGALKITTSAAGVASYANAEIAQYAVRVLFKQQPNSPVLLTTVSAVPFVDLIGGSIPDPTFATLPTISPSSGTAGTTTFTATDGTATNGTVTARRWLLSGTAIGTGTTVVPQAAGTLVRENTITGTNGTVIVGQSAGVVVNAAQQNPAPVFTTQPSISPTSGAVGNTFTANDGVATNADSYSRRWLLDGVQIGTGTTVVPVTAGSLVLEVTASNAEGDTVATSGAVVVAAAPGGDLTVYAGRADGFTIGEFDGTVGTVAYGDRPLTASGYTPQHFTASGGNLLTGTDF